MKYIFKNKIHIKHIKYIYHEIIFFTEHEKLHTYFKTKVVVNFFVNFFLMSDIDAHQLTVESFKMLIFSLKIYSNIYIYLNIKDIIMNLLHIYIYICNKFIIMSF